MESRTKAFVDLLNKYMGEQERNNSWVARQAGVSPNTVGRWLRYEYLPDEFESVIRLADGFFLDEDQCNEFLTAAHKPVLEHVQHLIANDDVTTSAALKNIQTRSHNKQSQDKTLDVTDIAIDVKATRLDARATRALVEWFARRMEEFSVQLSEVNNITERSISSSSSPLFHGVPALPNYFVGRDAMIETLVERLIAGNSIALASQTRTVTDKAQIALEGLPGIGKTTLAVALVNNAKILAHFDGGILWGGLGPESDATRVLDRWANILECDVSESMTERERSQVIKDAIGMKRVLLVIDDAWDVKSAQRLRCGGPNCCHLLTTRDFTIAREFAGLEKIVTVDVLDDIASRELLNLLAPEVCQTAPEAIEKLVKAAGGLPLTLTLLGGLLALPEHSMFEELREETVAALDELADPFSPMSRLRLAVERLGSLEDRELTLKETIALSLEILPEETRRVFYELGAFAPKPDWFGRKAAEIITHTSTKTLATLVARNLIEKINDTELAIHQTLADLARTSTSLETIAKHRSYYIGMVDKSPENWQQIDYIYGQIKWAWKTELNSSADIQLLDYVLSLEIYHQRRGLWDDQRQMFEEILPIVKKSGYKGVEGSIYDAFGVLSTRRGELGEAHGHYQKALSLFEELEDHFSEAMMLSHMGTVYFFQGEWHNALTRFQQAFRIFQQKNEYSYAVKNLVGIGAVHYRQGKWDEALQIFEHALLYFCRVGDKFAEARVLMNLGSVYRQMGRWNEAIEASERNLEIYKNLGDLQLINQSLANLSVMYIQTGKWENAIQACEQGITGSQELKDIYTENTIRINLGIVYSQQGRLDEAIEECKKSLPILEKIGDLRAQSQVHSTLGIIYRQYGDLEKATYEFNLDREICQQLGDYHGEAQTIMNIGNLYAQKSDWERAIELYSQALDTFQKVGDRYNEGQTYCNLGIAYMNQRQWSVALEMYNKDIEICRELGDIAGEAQTLINIGSVHYLQDKLVEAKDIWQEALSKVNPQSPDFEHLKALLKSVSGKRFWSLFLNRSK